MAAAGTLFGYGIRSAFTHERLSPAPGRRGTIEIGDCAAVTLDETAVVHRAEDGDTSFAIGRAADGTLAIECSAAGGFRLDAAHLRLLADRPPPGDDLWEHRLVSVALPLLLAERGDIALHAAAVAQDDQGVAFAGASTRGKSTLAVAASAAGLDVLADDGAVFDVADAWPIAWPGPVGARVAALGAGTKSTTPLGAAPLRPACLAAIAILGPLADGPTELDRLSPSAAVPALVPSLIFAGSDRLPDALRSAAWLAERVPVYRCRLPNGLDGLPAAVAAVVDRLLSPAGE